MIRTKIYFQTKNQYLRPYANVFLSDGVKNLGWPIFKITIGPGRTQDKTFRSIIKRLSFGEILITPFTYETFTKRCLEYIKQALKYCYIDNKIADKKLSSIKIYINDLIKSQNINLGNIAEHEICKMIVNRMIEKLREVPKRKISITEKFLAKNYFSPHGIWVNQSDEPFTFI